MSHHAQPRVRQRHRSSSRGLTLIEVTVSTLIVGALMVAALQSVGNMSRTTITTNQVHDGQSLAQDLLREILAQNYSDPADPTTTTWKGEAGETNRAAFDDIDDYDDWSESPVTDAAGNALAGYSGWSRTVVVRKLNTTDFSARSDTSTDTGLRSVIVTAMSPSGRTTILSVYRHSDGGTRHKISTNTDTVCWVGCTLQLGENAPSTMSASISNHAEHQ